VSSRKPFRILSLAGGGYLGLYSACVLAELEAHVGEPLARRFDLIAGSSVGGILAIGLAFELPMQEIKRLFVERGTEIFSARSMPTGRVGKLLDLTRSVLGPKYSGSALRHALAQHLGEQTLSEARHHVVVPAVNITGCQTKIFKTPHATGSTGDEHVRAIDAVMATCAAPAYFPSVQIGDSLFADGGMFAVAPDQVAMHEAEHFIGIKADAIRMLSIGTATMNYAPAETIAFDDGAVGWLSEGRLILTLISVQQQHVHAMMQDRLGERYFRLDAAWPAHEGLGIDVATPEAARTLAGLATTTMQQANMNALDRLFLRPVGR
jgi:uncharacterized protein